MRLISLILLTAIVVRALIWFWAHKGHRQIAQARQAVDIDRAASGMKREALDSRLGEDLATLAWAVAANATAVFAWVDPGAVSEVETLLAESFQLCGTKTRSVLAQIHYQAGKAYEALKMLQLARQHFHLAAEADPRGIYGRLAQTTPV